LNQHPLIETAAQKKLTGIDRMKEKGEIGTMKDEW
jgi:hypothetical protein